MKIGIAGVGGIGSNVAVYMVRSGIEQLKLVDFDRVEPGNLNRQFYFRDQVGSNKVDMLACNLRRINPSVKIDALMLKLDRTNMAACFADCDTVVEGLDGRRDKKNLLEALAGSGKPVISACGIAGCGTDEIHCRRMGNVTIVGDFKTDCHGHRIFAHKVAAVAAIMAGKVMEMAARNG